MTRLSAHGLTAELGRGWEGQIYLREPEPVPSGVQQPDALGSNGSDGSGTGGHRGGTVQYPVLQLANFALPAHRGDFGGGAVELMHAHHVFVSLFEYGPESAHTALFAARRTPWPIPAAAFGTNKLQRPLPGQGGAQFFFTESGRPFCLYVVLGSYLQRHAQVRFVNRVLHQITID